MSINVSCRVCGTQIPMSEGEMVITSWKCPNCGQGMIEAKGTGQIKADKDGNITFRT